MMHDELERRRKARSELAQRLSSTLSFALAAELDAESAVIARLIEAILTNTTSDLLLKIKPAE